jgi:hypothetical protein
LIELRDTTGWWAFPSPCRALSISSFFLRHRSIIGGSNAVFFALGRGYFGALENVIFFRFLLHFLGKTLGACAPSGTFENLVFIRIMQSAAGLASWTAENVRFF